MSPVFIQPSSVAPVLGSRLPSKDGLIARSGAPLSRRLNTHHLQGETLMPDNSCQASSAASPRSPSTPGRWAQSPLVAQSPLRDTKTLSRDSEGFAHASGTQAGCPHHPRCPLSWHIPTLAGAPLANPFPSGSCVPLQGQPPPGGGHHGAVSHHPTSLITLSH